MIPQDTFVIVAKVDQTRVAALRQELAKMTLADKPGMADPHNALVPFGNYGNIHFARFVVLEDNTAKDREAFHLSVEGLSIYLCFMVDCDGSANELLASMARDLPGLKHIFSHCQGFDPQGDVLAWLKARIVKPSAHYVNWIGRTVDQVHAEACLHSQLRAALPGIKSTDPQGIFTDLKLQVKPGKLTAAPPTPLAWRIYNLVHLLTPFAVVALVALVILLPWLKARFFPNWTIPNLPHWTIFLLSHLTTAFLLLLAVVLIFILTLAFVILLRRHEQTDPIVCEPYGKRHVNELRRGEDHDVTNQFTAMGSLKPGWFRFFTQIAVLYFINWVARHICTRGAIGRIGTIHFAHWMVIEGRARGFFCSNYDGSHESYMDDFINKTGFGLNLSFSGSIAYPVTNWLLARGAWLEQDFKRFQRHHQIPTDVWYKAYPGLTARDLARNSRIRNGFERAEMSDDEIRRWLAEI
jgi:hypothetical protein